MRKNVKELGDVFCESGKIEAVRHVTFIDSTKEVVSAFQQMSVDPFLHSINFSVMIAGFPIENFCKNCLKEKNASRQNHYFSSSKCLQTDKDRTTIERGVKIFDKIR